MASHCLHRRPFQKGMNMTVIVPTLPLCKFFLQSASRVSRTCTHQTALHFLFHTFYDILDQLVHIIFSLIILVSCESLLIKIIVTSSIFFSRNYNVLKFELILCCSPYFFIWPIFRTPMTLSISIPPDLSGVIPVIDRFQVKDWKSCSFFSG